MLCIALLALKVQSNDAVFVPSFTYIASAESIALVGGVPYFVDVGDDYNMVSQLGIQAIGSLFTIVFTAVVTVVILLIIKHTVGLRVDEADESIGLDQSAHGETAYND